MWSSDGTANLEKSPEQDDSEEQQLKCGRKTCTSRKDDSAASQGEDGRYGRENCDRSTLPQFM